ncbi:primosomal protein N' [Ignavibacteria bacterium]|nr:primosomal protein N' [Bacteroidota bacterium]MCZ2132784.1 primosomal protein N' [Bacteroidota bacterium]
MPELTENISFVVVALPIPLHRQFTYSVKGELPSDIIGRRVLAPFGKRILTGIIVAVPETAPSDHEIRPIMEILDDAPIFNEKLLEFTKWVAEYYFASWGETLKAALPLGMSPHDVMRVKTAEPVSEQIISEIAKKAPKRAALLRELSCHSGEVTVGYLEKKLQSSTIADQLDALERAGLIICERVVEGEARAKIRKAAVLNGEAIGSQEQFREVLNTLDAKAPKQALALSYIYIQHRRLNGEPILAADIVRETKVNEQAVEGLAAKGYIRLIMTEVVRREHIGDSSLAERDETALPLTAEQDHAVRRINDAITAQKHKTFLLHGVTGSGKTLVYFHAIKQTAAIGKTSLFLVPEISLTPQLIDRFRAAFGERHIAVVHSRMAIGERYDQWRQISAGKVRVVIGTRSAIFAPIENLGLIIIDEEHEPSYKQDAPAPRYNARDCAVARGKMENTAVILGSATPSMESMYNASIGKYHLLEISARADNAKLPAVRTVNMLNERKHKRILKSFSKELLDAIADRTEKREGIILFHNRRGFATHIECNDCGAIPKCRNCSVTLTYHKTAHQLRCHYCSYTRIVPNACETCGGLTLRDIGAGTQRIEEELSELLEMRGIKVQIARMDTDTTSKRGAHRAILRDFAEGKTDILVGTQMVAKGLDFKRVTLVGVINADMRLFMPDFRASERTFQLLMQVVGRAGRSADSRGEALIQTSHPEHQTILAAVEGRYDHFYGDELQLRKDAYYPPFTRFVTVEFSGADEQKTHEHARWFAHFFPKNTPSLIMLGPAAPTIWRLRSLYRRLLIIKDIKHIDPSGEQLRNALRTAYALYQQHTASSSVKVIIDIDSFGGL